MTYPPQNTGVTTSAPGTGAHLSASANTGGDVRSGGQALKVICFQFDPNICGPHVRARAVYPQMAKDGHVARIVIPAGEGSAEAFYRDTGIAVDRLAIRKPVSPSRKGAFLLYLLSLPLGVARTIGYLRRTRPDVIHVNGAYDLVPALAGRLAGLPVVWHLIDMAPPRPVARLLGRIVSSLASRIIIVANAVGTHYGVDPDRAELIFEPVDTNQFAARNPAGRPGTPAVIGLLANWNPLKGQDRFIEVIRRLRARGHSVRGRVMGAFNERQSRYWRPLLVQIQRDGLDEAIERLGFVENPSSALSELDVMLLTSRSEACPISVLEAMAVGIPQVCFQVGGVDGMLGTNRSAAGVTDDESAEAAGLTVPEGDVEAMVEAVEALLTERDLYLRQSRAGPARARAHFSLEVCVARHHAVYAAAIGERRRPA